MQILALIHHRKDLAYRRSDTEILVRDATSNEPYGPSGTEMRKVADLTADYLARGEIMTVLWERIEDDGKNWRHVYKVNLQDAKTQLTSRLC